MNLQFPTPDQLQALYAADLTASFPPSELKPLSAIRRMWDCGRYRPWCLFDGETPVGTAFLWLGRPGWALLDYLCVSPRRRNAGLGGVLLERLRQAEPRTVILAETEAPDTAPDPAMARRRLGFYARNHARLAGFDAEVFGVDYQLVYWWDQPLLRERLIEEYDFVYRDTFTPEKYAQYVQIPRIPGVDQPRVPWDE